MLPTVSTALVSAALAACVAFASSAVSAQTQRQFPQTALRGALVVVAAPEVTLNDAAARLAPGARIRDVGNMVQMSASLTGMRLLVHYTVDPYGLIKDVWILRPEEASREPWPRTVEQARTWRFDPVAQRWTRP